MKAKNIIIALSVLLNVVLGFLFYNQTTKINPIDIGLSFKEAVRVEE